MNLPDLNYKKIGLVIGFFATSIFLGWLIYAVFFRAPVTPTTEIKDDEIDIGKTTQIQDTGKRLPTSKTEVSDKKLKADKTALGGITVVSKLTQDNTGGATLDSSGMRSAFYNKKDVWVMYNFSACPGVSSIAKGGAWMCP